MYLELACHDEQNGGQSFKIRARIPKLWRFKAPKRKKFLKENCLAILKPGLWQAGFSRCSEKWYFSAGTNGE